jgi:DUF4097 and DUF4098 domain-containing protein YvlB
MVDNRMAIAVLVATGAGVAVFGFGDKTSTETQSVNETISALRMESGSSDVSIQVGDKTTVEVKRSYWWGSGDSKAAYELDGDTLVLKSDCGMRCDVKSFVVTVPAGTKVTGSNGSGDLDMRGRLDIDARSGSGDVTAEDTDGPVALQNGSGSITVDGANGAVNVKTGSGEITLRDVSGGPVQARTGSGDLELSVETPMSVDAQTGSGDLELRVPEGTYKVETDSGSGDRNVNVQTNPNATHTLKLKTGSGDLNVNAN